MRFTRGAGRRARLSLRSFLAEGRLQTGALAGFLLLAAAALLPTADRVAGGQAGAPQVEDFLNFYWQTPIPPQGEPPKRFSALEASLDPEMCAACHRQQYDDWKTSLHSKSMGPGVLGQTVDLIRSDPETALLCYACHAPLSEQQEKIRAAATGALVDNRAFDAKLQRHGATCAGCHVRGHQRFGAPRRDGSLESALPRDQLPHNGVTRTIAFERAEFCRGCHQFSEDGLAVNGKLLENTYNEWREGPYAKAGMACQQCHMPDRRHLWRGIHDPDMVRQAITVEVKPGKARYAVGERLQATVAVTNSGAGHYFPTYVTPKVFIRTELIDAGGKTVKGTFKEDVIGRELPLDLSREIYDTRIPPKGTHTFRYVQRVPAKGLRLKVAVVIYPDHFYTKFFQATIPNAEAGRARLEAALAASQRSHFTVFEKTIPVS